jgi:hypothetical protein
MSILLPYKILVSFVTHVSPFAFISDIHTVNYFAQVFLIRTAVNNIYYLETSNMI